jgi:hypothetical protein
VDIHRGYFIVMRVDDLDFWFYFKSDVNEIRSFWVALNNEVLRIIIWDNVLRSLHVVIRIRYN